jgi:hypothetical protein
MSPPNLVKPVRPIVEYRFFFVIATHPYEATISCYKYMLIFRRRFFKQVLAGLKLTRRLVAGLVMFAGFVAEFYR